MTPTVWTSAEPDPLDRLPKFCLLPCLRDGRVMGHYGRVAGQLAHRWRWEQAFGPIPAGLSVLHHCDNPPCIELDHLYLGTDADNAHDRDARGRNGRQVLTPAQVIEIRARYAAGGISQKALGDAYGVSRNQVARIVRRERWTRL